MPIHNDMFRGSDLHGSSVISMNSMSPRVQLLYRVQKPSLFQISSFKLFSYPLPRCILTLEVMIYLSHLRKSSVTSSFSSYGRKQYLSYPCNCISDKTRDAYSNSFISLAQNVSTELLCKLRFWGPKGDTIVTSRWMVKRTNGLSIHKVLWALFPSSHYLPAPPKREAGWSFS